MDIIQFVEDILGVELSEYQKKLFTYLYKHKDAKIIMPKRMDMNNICPYLFCMLQRTPNIEK